MRVSCTASQSESHPDANVLTAYAEGRLLKRERLGILAHLADCDACRQVTYLVQLTEDRKQEPEAAKPRLWTGTRLAIPVACTALLLCLVINQIGTTTLPDRQWPSLASRPAVKTARSPLPASVPRVRRKASLASQEHGFSPAPSPAWMRELFGSPAHFTAVREPPAKVPALEAKVTDFMRKGQNEPVFLRIETPRPLPPLRPLPKLSLDGEPIRSWTHLCSNPDVPPTENTGCAILYREDTFPKLIWLPAQLAPISRQRYE